MKGLTTLSFFALLYLVIIIIFNEVASEPRGVEDKNVGQSASGAEPSKDDNDRNGAKNATDAPSSPQANFGNVATEQFPSQKDGVVGGSFPNSPPKPVQRAAGDQRNDSNPLADLFQIGDPTMRTAMGAIYGAYKGNDQCSRKAFCMMGNYMKDMPGRDLLFLFMGNYIPPDYSLYYEIFKVAVMYGQNCEVYVCIPDATPPDAATAARPSSQAIPSQTGSQQQQQKLQQQQQQKPNRPQGLENAFDNNIPR